MAGFDFYQGYRPDTEQLLRSLLRKLQRVAHAYGLSVHFKHERESCRYYVTVDGPLPMMQSSAVTMVTVLPPFAEGAIEPADRARRVRVANRLGRDYWRHVLRMGEMVFDMTTRFGGVPNSFVFDTDAHSEELDERMWSLTWALIAYENGEVGPPQIVEEVHTGLEWLMRTAIGRSAKSMSYAGMVENLCTAGVLDADLRDDVLKMKDIRRGAKHRGVPAERQAVNAVLHPSIEACHRLLRYVGQLQDLQTPPSL